MRKLKSRAGESVAETLCAVLMISLVFLFLAGSIVTAARINKEIAPEEKTFQRVVETTQPGQVILRGDGVLSETDVDVTIYRTDNGYYYYEIP